MAKDDFSTIPMQQVRNIGIIAHIDAGKTTTTERLLFFTGKIHKIGEVHEGAATMDYLPEEQKRGVTIVAAATTCFWKYKSKKYRVNIIDTPGHVDFTAEVERSLRILDGAVVVFDGKSGVQAQTETVWRQADKYNVPRICFINKLNLVGSDFYMSLNSIQERLSKNAVAVHLPIGTEYELKGVVDLVEQKAYVYEGDPKEAVEIVEAEIPGDMADKVVQYRQILIEKAVEQDDKLMEDYLEGKEISVKDLRGALRKAVINNDAYLVSGGDSRSPVARKILDMVMEYLPSPLELPAIEGTNPKNDEIVVRSPSPEDPLSALVFKVVTDPHVGTIAFIRVYSGTILPSTYVWNSSKDIKERVSRLMLMHANHREETDKLVAGEIGVAVGLKNSSTGHTLSSSDNPIVLESIVFPEPVVSAAVEPKTKADVDKLSLVLQKIAQEDPTFKVEINHETGQTLISGMGQFHLIVLVERMEREYGLQLTLGEPKVAYRESIGGSAKAEGKFIKQSGGRGQYGHCWLEVEPSKSGEGFEFVDAIKGGSIPKEYVSSIEKGVAEALQSGVVAGYPIEDVKVTVYDGSYHDVDSSDAAFKMAGAIAFRAAMKLAKPYLLEPVMKIEVVVPDEYVGAISGILSSKRGQIQSTNTRGDVQVIVAQIPLSETFDFTSKLRSASSGRGDAYLEFSKYDKVPQSVQKVIVEGK